MGVAVMSTLILSSCWRSVPELLSYIVEDVRPPDTHTDGCAAESPSSPRALTCGTLYCGVRWVCANSLRARARTRRRPKRRDATCSSSSAPPSPTRTQVGTAQHAWGVAQAAALTGLIGTGVMRRRDLCVNVIGPRRNLCVNVIDPFLLCIRMGQALHWRVRS
jgi:hypothetical protein